MEWIANPDIWISLATLTLLEIVLGIDNLIFIAILVRRLPEKQQAFGRMFGLTLAMLTRIGLLFSIAWLIGLTAPLFSALGQSFSWRDLILIGGGLFLIGKAVIEIHHKVEPHEEGAPTAALRVGLLATIVQIGLIDIIFSLDSVITAVGMTDQIYVMVAAIVASMAVMLFASGAVTRFIDSHPTVTMLALAFLILIGMMLVADGLGQKIPKGYIYFAMAFAVLVEGLNMLARRRRKAVAQSSGVG
jgi:predicted tellurium resistance membrane protein TerC